MKRKVMLHNGPNPLPQDADTQLHASRRVVRTVLAYAVAYVKSTLTMNAPRRATLFTNGSNQAIRIPRDFELTGKEALIRKEGERLIIEPVPPPKLLAVLATLEPIDEAFPDVHDPVPEPVDL